MRSDHPHPRAARSGRYLLAALALLLLAAGGVLYWLLPAATGYASHYLCVRVLAGGEADPQTVFEREVKPINPLFRLVTYRIDHDTATASAAGLGLLRKTVALYRPGLGCTVSPATDLDALRAQGQGLGLPAARDPETPGAAEPPALAKVLDRALAEPGPKSLRNTLAVVVRQHGAIVGERYAPGVGTETPLLGWSMTKTVTGLLAGTLVADGKLSLDQTDLMPEWSAPDDPRRSIQLRNLLQWNSGLDYHEGYLPGSDTTTMLYQSADMAHFVASRPLAQPPGHQVDYQSGGSVLVANIAARALSPRPLAIVPFARARLFAPLGIHTAMLEPDAAGTLVGGSYMLASARDWSKIGQLILQHGEWRGRRIVDADWIRFMSTPQTALGDSQHGAHLWLNAGLAGERRFPSLPEDLTMLDGFNYQLVVIVPSCQAVITRLGATVDRSWNTETFVHDVMASLPGCTPPLKTAMR